MKCVNVYESGDGEWTIYAGVDPGQHKVSEYCEYDDREAAVEAAKKKADETILVISSDCTAGYDTKLVSSGWDWEEA